jgi:hypothetical protein
MWLDEDDDKDILVVQCEGQNEKCWNCTCGFRARKSQTVSSILLQATLPSIQLHTNKLSK